jgi:hypothetical protein
MDRILTISIDSTHLIFWMKIKVKMTLFNKIHKIIYILRFKIIFHEILSTNLLNQVIIAVKKQVYNSLHKKSLMYQDLSKKVKKIKMLN